MNKVVNITLDVNVAEGNNFDNLKLIQALRKAIDKEIQYFGYTGVSANFGNLITLKYMQEEL